MRSRGCCGETSRSAMKSTRISMGWYTTASSPDPSPGARERTPESHYLRFDDRGRLSGIVFMNPREQLEREGAVYVSLPEGDRVRVQGIEAVVRDGDER